MNKIMVTTRKRLDELIKGSALTWEGLAMDSEEDFKAVVDWMSEHGATLKTQDVYITKGCDMNQLEDLTGRNAYPDDLSIVSFKLSDIENVDKLFIARFQVGARWMDDVVENNRRREARF